MLKELSLKNEEADFNALKKASQEIADQCNKIVVTDATTLSIAKQQLSIAKDRMKHIEELHKKYKAPYWDACKQLDNLKNALYTPLGLAVDHGKGQILKYEQAEQKKAQEEFNRINSIRNRIVNHSAWAIQAMDGCKTIEALNFVYEKWVKIFPGAEIWMEFTKEADQMRANLRLYASQRKIQILTPAEADDDTQEIIKDTIADEVQNVAVNDLNAIDTRKAKGIRETWKHQVVEVQFVEKRFMVPDEKALAEHAKYLGKSGLVEDGQIMSGVRYFKEQSVTIR